jgi:hypothetical protein
MCRLQGVKMHIATSLQLPQQPGTTWPVLGWIAELGLPVTSQIWFVPFSETQFRLPRVSLSEFIHSCAILISYLFVVRKTWKFECSIPSDTFETESELVRDAEAGATSLY